MLDVIIIGGGLAGLTAGIYCQRGGLKTILFEKMFPGGQVTNTFEVENYPGFVDPISGPEFAMAVENQARKFGLEIMYDEITRLELNGVTKKVYTSKDVYEAKTIIIATGANPKKLGLEKEEELIGKGVSYCATCDGAFYKDKDVIVVGGGDTAVEEALFLSKYCSKVYLIHRRDKLRASKIIADRAMENSKIEIVWDSVVEELQGDDKLTGIRVKNVKTNEVKQIDAEGIFVAIGIKPNNELLENQINMTEAGFVLTDETMETNISGVYAAGDIRQKPLWQLVTAAADGAVAAVSAQRYIVEKSKN